VRLYFQWTQANPQTWQELDLLPTGATRRTWEKLPRKPLPQDTDPIDDNLGWIAALNVQGVAFTGADHYAVEPITGGLRVTVWHDDPDDFPVGKRWADVWTFLTLAPDAKLGGAYNTRQSVVRYAEPDAFDFPFGTPHSIVTWRPWSEFILPASGITMHGKWVPDALWAQHKAQQTLKDWREWTDGLPFAEIEGGKLREQRKQGRYAPSIGTRTYYQRDTNRATGLHALTNEDAFETSAGASETESVVLNFAKALVWVFTTPSNEPNSADWPNGTYRIQLDVTAAGADTTYGVVDLDASGGPGHFGKTDAALTTETSLGQQAEATFTGTGLKLATLAVDPAAGLATDRFEVLVEGKNSVMGDQTLTLRFSSDAWADGPWTAADGNLTLQSVGGVAAVSNLVVGTPRVTLQSVAGVASLLNVELATPGKLVLDAVAGAGNLPNVELATPGNLTLQAVTGTGSLPNLELSAPTLVALGAVGGIAIVSNVELGTPRLNLGTVVGIATLPNVEVGTPRLNLDPIAGIASLPNVEVGTPRLNLDPVAGIAALPNVEVGTPRLNLDPVAGIASLANVTITATFSPLELQAIAGVAAVANVEWATPAILSLGAVGGIASLANVEITTAAPPAGADASLLLKLQ